MLAVTLRPLAIPSRKPIAWLRARSKTTSSQTTCARSQFSLGKDLSRCWRPVQAGANPPYTYLMQGLPAGAASKRVVNACAVELAVEIEKSWRALFP